MCGFQQDRDQAIQQALEEHRLNWTATAIYLSWRMANSLSTSSAATVSETVMAISIAIEPQSSVH